MLVVFDYQELAPIIALLRDPDQARRFVSTALEPFRLLVDRPWTLPTLEAYAGSQGHMKEVAHVLGVHLNTVKYRMGEIRDAAGASAIDGAAGATLLLALQLRRIIDAADV